MDIYVVFITASCFHCGNPLGWLPCLSHARCVSNLSHSLIQTAVSERIQLEAWLSTASTILQGHASPGDKLAFLLGGFVMG